MTRTYLTALLLLLAFTSLGQRKEIKFYSYLQSKTVNAANENDSIVIDQFSGKEEKYNWQAVIKVKGDSCYVIFLPPQYSQDTMVLPGELTIINIFTTSKANLVAAFEQAKSDLKKYKQQSDVVVEVSVTYRASTDEFKLRRVQQLYDILRYNKPTDTNH
jgi:hypothetical protein